MTGMEQNGDMQRYSVIDGYMPREFILLQGTGCRWRKCTFCNYHNDVSADPFALNKGVLEQVTGVCLLSCTSSHTREQIVSDIDIAAEYFEYFSVNLFCNNGTVVKRDETLVKWFVDEIYPQLKINPKAEVLLNNTDLGVGSCEG